MQWTAPIQRHRDDRIWLFAAVRDGSPERPLSVAKRVVLVRNRRQPIRPTSGERIAPCSSRLTSAQPSMEGVIEEADLCPISSRA